MKVNIDVLLEKDQLELIIGEKSYVVRDIPLKVFLDAIAMGERAQSEETDLGPIELRNQLALILGVKPEELDSIGFRSMILALSEIRLWMTNSGESREAGPVGNP